MNLIKLPDPNTLPKNERGDWVCYFKGNKNTAKQFHELLKQSGIVSFGPNNYTNTRKVYYVTKFGGVFSIDRSEFNNAKNKILTYSRFIADTLTGKSLEDDINNSYEIKF